jgi:endonuclease/exonuclease/phosphatase family metal-dependent hydrolase
VRDTIRIMTWNVHGTFKLNPHFDPDGVCAIIEKWAPDIVALQEVDSRGRSDDVFGRLTDSVGEHRVEARSIIAEDGHYGQVLLSRWPFAAEPKITDVSYQEREPWQGDDLRDKPLEQREQRLATVTSLAVFAGYESLTFH